MTRSWVGGVALLSIGLMGCERELPPYARAYDSVRASCSDPEDPPDEPFEPDGFLEGALYFDCDRPRASEGGVGFEDIRGVDATVSGVPLAFELRPTDDSFQGTHVIFWYEDTGRTAHTGGVPITANDRKDRGFYAIPIESGMDRIPVELLVSPEASGGYNLAFAIADGSDDIARPRIGPIARTSSYVINVGSGDLQMNLHWDTFTDLDLHVFDPNGDQIYYFNKEVPSGGMLDLDSYPDCDFALDPGRGNENVFWGTGDAPRGTYRVVVDMYSDCSTYAVPQETEYKVTVVVDRSVVRTYSGVFAGPFDEQTHVVVEFEY